VIENWLGIKRVRRNNLGVSVKRNSWPDARIAHWIFLTTLIIAPMISAQAVRTTKTFVYIGTYTEHGSRGIYVCEFDPMTGRLASPLLAAETLQPSFLAVSSDQKFLYAVNEVDKFNGQSTGAVSAFSLDSATQKLILLDQVSSRDPGPAHIVLDRAGHFVLVANYDGGSVAVFRLLPDGQIGESTAFVRHKGSSVNHKRQEGPHAHAIAMSPDNRFAIVADLGLDQLLVYPFDASAGLLGQPHIVKTDPGVGPRHLAFSSNGKLVYVINELNSTITVYSYASRDGAMAPLQTISSLPSGAAGSNTAAEIVLHPSGKFLYASNRGDDNSIAVFSVDPKKGTLTALEHVPTAGKTPRSFSIDPTGKWLLVANQDSNTVVTFRIDRESGRLTQTGQSINLNSPAMLEFVSLQ
jgi:6-phosphogluconolactonase